MLTVKGSPMSKSQLNCANLLLQQARMNSATTNVMQAIIFAAIMESDLGDDVGPNSAGYGGALAGAMSYFGHFGSASSPAVWVQQAQDFCVGGHGFRSAIQLDSQYPNQPGKLAAAVEEPVLSNGTLGPSGYGQYFNQSINTPSGVHTGLAAMNTVVGEAVLIVQEHGGGGITGSTAGVSTGTKSSQTAPFYIGGSSNPSEDVWTGINRLAQERYWYLFSDGETLYLADGATIMQQDPAMTLDRWGDLDKIVSLSFNWDNTAWQYASDHRKRRRVIRKTQMAKISSPVEAELDVICPIDYVRAGDVVKLSGCGPGDGKWLVGTARRSIFKIYSELTLVPAVNSLSEQQAAGAGLSSGSNADVPGVTGGNTPGTIIFALDSAAATINNKNYPFVPNGGHAIVGQPDTGGGHGQAGYDAAGAIAAILGAAGLWSGGVPGPQGIISGLEKKHLLTTGRGSGVPEFSLFVGNGYFFAYINAQGTGQYWGSNDGAGLLGAPKTANVLVPGRNLRTLTPIQVVLSQQSGSTGGSWLNPPTSLKGLTAYHIPQNILGDLLNNASLGTLVGTYTNPFKTVSSALRPERVDMGVDYYAPGGSQILAIGDGTVYAVAASGSGWISPTNTQAFVGYTLSDGSYEGKSIYVAEDIIPKVSVGQTITAGQVIATFIGSSTGLETGWATGSGYGCLAASLNQQAPGDPGAWSSAAGISFNRFLTSLGAPSGSPIVGNGVHGSPLPNGYPGAPYGNG